MSTGGKVAWPAANPWGKSIAANVSSLSSVMDEEYAKQLQVEEEAVITADSTADSASPLLEIPADLADEMGPETSSDLLLAQMLQLQFDREYDAELAREEQKCNGSSKVGISFSNYRSVHPAYYDDVDDDEEDFQEDWIQGDVGSADFSVEKSSDQGKKKNIVTKHDAQVCGRKNASRVMDQFPPDFPSGNSIGMDMKLSNSVYNVLKIHSQKEESKAQRLHEKKEHSTAEMAVDSRTRIMLYKLVNNGLLDSITGSISTGKEAVVIHAYGGQMDDQIIPAECALKVFKTTLNEFKTRDQYIRNDYRFRARFKKKNPRRFIHMWAEKEMHNLTRIRESGIRCPEVVLLRKHILVMSFIGKEQKAAPKLKHVRFSTSEAQCVYEECLTMVEKLYQECNLIHADLSEYNMLWHEGHIWLIDVSQSVEPTHPHGLEFLLRDCTNVSNFFTKLGVHGVLKPHEIFNRVTGLDLVCGNEQQFLAQIDALQQSEKFKPSSPKETNFAFDYFFEKGMTFAAMYSMFAMWIPSEERSRLPVYTFSGSCLGNILGQAVSGPLASSDILGGWPAPFFLFGTLGLVWFCAWLCLAYDSPSDHPRISIEERQYIESGISVKPRSKSKEVPWGKILTSVPVWAIVVAHLTACWCYFTLLTNLPIYMNNVLQLDLTRTGIFSAVPYAFQWLSMSLTGIPADRLINGGALPRTTVRKILVVTGHLGFGITNVLVGLSGCNSALSVLFLSLGLLFAGVTFSGYLTNTLDLAPAYSGSIGGLVQTAGPVSGILGPFAVGVLTVDQNDLLGWKKVFYIGFGITAFGALFFALFSSGEEQPWSEGDKCDKDEQED